MYRTLFHRIDLRGRLTPEDLLSYFNDKDLRVIMGHNGININEFCAADKKYKERTKVEKARTLLKVMGERFLKDPDDLIAALTAPEQLNDKLNKRPRKKTPRAPTQHGRMSAAPCGSSGGGDRSSGSGAGSDKRAQIDCCNSTTGTTGIITTTDDKQDNFRNGVVELPGSADFRNGLTAFRTISESSRSSGSARSSLPPGPPPPAAAPAATSPTTTTTTTSVSAVARPACTIDVLNGGMGAEVSRHMRSREKRKIDRLSSSGSGGGSDGGTTAQGSKFHGHGSSSSGASSSGSAFSRYNSQPVRPVTTLQLQQPLTRHMSHMNPAAAGGSAMSAASGGNGGGRAPSALELKLLQPLTASGSGIARGGRCGSLTRCVATDPSGTTVGVIDVRRYVNETLL